MFSMTYTISALTARIGIKAKLDAWLLENEKPASKLMDRNRKNEFNIMYMLLQD